MKKDGSIYISKKVIEKRREKYKIKIEMKSEKRLKYIKLFGVETVLQKNKFDL